MSPKLNAVQFGKTSRLIKGSFTTPKVRKKAGRFQKTIISPYIEKCLAGNGIISYLCLPILGAKTKNNKYNSFIMNI